MTENPVCYGGKIVFENIKVRILCQNPLEPLQILKYCEYPSGLKTTFHSGKQSQALLILSGSVSFREEGFPEETHFAGKLVVLPARIRYRWKMDKETVMFQCIYENFSFREHKDLAILFGAGTKHLAAVDIGMKKALSFQCETDRLFSEASKSMDIHLSLMCLGLFACALDAYRHLHDDTGNGHPALETAIRYMELNIHREISISKLARHSFLGVSRLSQLFRERIGMSPMRYFSKMKTEKAIELLLTSNMSIGEISDSLGFNSINYFSRFFKSQTGESPKKSRNRNII